MSKLLNGSMLGSMVLLLFAGQGLAQELQTVVVTATRVAQPSFELPVSISTIAGAVIQEGRQQVNLSESLARVPGVLAQNRQNYAQDLQISIRGFGARSTFGVRGVRLYADGIPATLPDGQGQVSHFDLGSAGRIEILRGPFSSLYGNSSGGVIALFTEQGPADPTLTGTLSTASFGARRAAVKFAGETADGNYVVDVSRFNSDGYRDHSETQRNAGNAVVRVNLNEDSQLTLVANALKLDADDPLGLTAAQLQSNPQQAGTGALSFDTRKTVGQQQLGLNYERRWNEAITVTAMAYTGHRTTVQFQSIPTASQFAATSSGGVIDLDRDYWGGDLHLTHSGTIAGGRTQLTAGLSYDRLDESRQGYQNFIGAQLGVRGALRRDESNLTFNVDQYVQAQWDRARWLLLLGVRNSAVKFDSDDHYRVAGNGDDSGSRSYRATTPVAGMTYRLTADVNLYAAYGEGFETPTFNEIAYRSVDGTQTGLNLGLRPARSQHYELGVKSRLSDAMNLNTTVFRSDTRNELAVLANAGGRSVFQNVNRSSRAGVELEFNAQWPHDLSTAIAYTWLRARYDDAFSTCAAPPCVLTNNTANAIRVAAGNDIPGVPATSAYAELAWRHPRSGFNAALEARYADAVYADDANTARTRSALLGNLQLGFTQLTRRWRIQEFLRIDNVTDRNYVGSVIVNESNQRYFEPAPGRNWLLGVQVAATW